MHSDQPQRSVAEQIRVDLADRIARSETPGIRWFPSLSLNEAERNVTTRRAHLAHVSQQYEAAYGRHPDRARLAVLARDLGQDQAKKAFGDLLAQTTHAASRPRSNGFLGFGLSERYRARAEGLRGDPQSYERMLADPHGLGTLSVTALQAFREGYEQAVERLGADSAKHFERAAAAYHLTRSQRLATFLPFGRELVGQTVARTCVEALEAIQPLVRVDSLVSDRAEVLALAEVDTDERALVRCEQHVQTLHEAWQAYRNTPEGQTRLSELHPHWQTKTNGELAALVEGPSSSRTTTKAVAAPESPSGW